MYTRSLFQSVMDGNQMAGYFCKLKPQQKIFEIQIFSLFVIETVTCVVAIL